MNTTPNEAAVLDSLAQVNDQAELSTVEQIAVIAKHVTKSVPSVKSTIGSLIKKGLVLEADDRYLVAPTHEEMPEPEGDTDNQPSAVVEIEPMTPREAAVFDVVAELIDGAETDTDDFEYLTTTVSENLAMTKKSSASAIRGLIRKGYLSRTKDDDQNEVSMSPLGERVIQEPQIAKPAPKPTRAPKMNAEGDKPVRAGVGHKGCDHESSTKARSKCRTMRAKLEELTGSAVVGSEDGYQQLDDGRAVKLGDEDAVITR